MHQYIQSTYRREITLLSKLIDKSDLPRIKTETYKVLGENIYISTLSLNSSASIKISTRDIIIQKETGVQSLSLPTSVFLLLICFYFDNE
jgi:hypothetical protein